MRSFSQIVLRNSAFGMGAQLIIKVLSFIFTVLIVRNLGAEDYGQYMAVLAFGAIFVFIADLGLSPYTVREVARMRGQPGGDQQIAQLYSDVLMLRFLLSILAAALLIGAAWLTGRPTMMVIAIALGTIGLLMYSLQGTSDSLLAGHERLDLSSGAKILYQVAFVGLGGLALWFGVGYFGLIGANLVGIALMTLICWNGVRRLGVRFGSLTPGRWAGLIRKALPFGIIGFTLGISYKFDTVLLNIFRGDTETGHYAAAYNLIFSLVLVSNMINTALYPSLTRQAASDPASLPTIYERSLLYLLLISLPVAVGGAALAHQIVPFLFGDSYADGVLALQLLIWVVPLMFATEFLGYVVTIAGMEGRVAKAVVASTSVNVVINIAAVPLFGLIGAAVTTVITEIVLASQYIWMLRHNIGRAIWGRVLLRPLAAALLMGAIVVGLDRLGLYWMLNIAAGGIVYLALLLAMGVVGPNELRFVRSLRRGEQPAPTGH